MTRIISQSTIVGLALGAAFLMGGCPQTMLPLEVVAGSTGDNAQLGTTASVEVLAPVNDFSITGGTPVEVAWRSVATTRVAVQEVIIDVDQTPDNGNELVAAADLPLTTSSIVLDTSDLPAGEFFIGVALREVGEVAAFDYASGRISVNARSTLFFTAPRDNFEFDRSVDIIPSFNVAWTVNDPDSIVSVQIFLDPDGSPNGNEVLLRESNSQTGDSFSFDFPTASFEPGTYRILAIVSDGLTTESVYAPGRILVRSRISGKLDLRGIEFPDSPLRGAIFEGFNPRDNAGSIVGTINDLDGDSFEDFVIVAQFGKPGFDINVPRTGVGEAYLIYGRPQRFSGRINLNSTGTLFRGEIFAGAAEVPDPIRPSRGITSITKLDDWDRDGVPEFAFGMPFTDSLADTGRSPLDQNGYFRTGGVVILAGSVFRPDLGFPGRNTIDLQDIGSVLHAPTSCLDCTAQNACPCREGFYGPKAPSPVNACDVTFFHEHIAGPVELGSERLGARYSTVDFGDQCGESISSYDFDSIIISVPNRDSQAVSTRVAAPTPGAGSASIIFNNTGNSSYPWSTAGAPAAAGDYIGPQPNVDTRAIPHGGPYHFIFDDIRTFGFLVAVGNTDELPTFTVRQNAPGYIATTDSLPCPEFGDSGVRPEADATTRFYGGFEGARVGNAVGIEDFNTDGIEDILIGSPLSDESRGSVFVVLGRLRRLVRGGDLNVEELGLPLNAINGPERLFDGIRVIGEPGDRLGTSQDSVGDFNGDGIADVIIGSPFVNDRQGGAAIFFGSRDVQNLTAEEIPYSELATRGLGINFVGEREGDFAG
ncbi:MAG: integrin alpha, partial [Phycisphaerae bacterium]